MRQKKTTTCTVNINDDAVSSYFATIAKQRQLTADEEAALARRIRMGDHAALEQLVCANLRFVVAVAKQFQNRGLEFSDLISEGNIGLIHAAEKFDEARGVKFISYAVWHIREHIMDALSRYSRTIRMPHSQFDVWYKIREYQDQVTKTLGRDATVEEIAYSLGLTTQEVTDALKAANCSTSLDATLCYDSDNSLLDIYPDDVRADAELDKESAKQELERLFHTVLREREVYIIRHSYGIDCDELTQEQMGAELGLSRERVRQVRDQAIIKLHDFGAQYRYRLCC